jgi:hypothetical protein
MHLRGRGEPVLKMSEGRPIAICWDCKNCGVHGPRSVEGEVQGQGGLSTSQDGHTLHAG